MANFANDSTDRLCEMRMKAEGVKNPEKFANVINGCPLRSSTCQKACQFSLINPQAQLKQAADEAKEREKVAVEQRCRQLESLKQKSRHDQVSNMRMSIWVRVINQ